MLSTYKQKCLALIAFIVAMLVLLIFNYILPSVHLYYDNQNLIIKSENALLTPGLVEKLSNELASIEADNDKSDTTDYIVNKFSLLCSEHRVTLMHLPDWQTYKLESFSIETKVVKLQGKFIPLLQVLNSLEYDHRVGKISSCDFAMEEDRRTRVNNLFATIYLQKIKLAKGR